MIQMTEGTYINVPFVPDLVAWTAYSYGICDLCLKEKSENKKFDNSKCIHCQKLTKCCSGMYVPKNKEC